MKINKAKLISFLISVMALLLAGGYVSLYVDKEK